ncbi:PaaX-like protein C-terminal domain-containing protein [Pseudomonas cichorii]|nr:PaaX-like protein C-terminal domain-containing protein [Pseudomonas cichorii]
MQAWLGCGPAEDEEAQSRALALSDRWWNQKTVAQDYRAGELEYSRVWERIAERQKQESPHEAGFLLNLVVHSHLNLISNILNLK